LVDAPVRRAAPPATVLTGATGWLGRALVERLLTDGRPGLRALVRDPAEGAALAARGVEVVAGDITDRRDVLRLFAGIPEGADVLHGAGIIHPRVVADFARVNAQGTRSMVEVARSAGVRRFVHVSSNSPFGTNPVNGETFRNQEPYHPYLGYGTSKMQGELAVLAGVEHGLDAVIVRPPWFYGPFQPERQTTFFTLVRTGRFPMFAGGVQRRSMVYVDNLVEGVMLAELTEGITGRGYWIADARPYEVREIVDTVRRALADEGYHVSGRPRSLPIAIARAAETADRMIQRVGRYQQQVHVLGEMGHSIACDIAAARADLGYDPAVELYEGMRRSIRWCRDQGISL
jgi:nucleoside-diphosphate-sugar epimerase